jgi:hypothetical protein
MRVRSGAAVALLLTLVACGTSPATQQRAVIDTITRNQAKPTDFSYRDESLDDSQRITIEGRRSDDFLYQGTVALNGSKLYEMIVSDDAVALRLLDLNATRKVVSLASRIDPPTGAALGSGHWVVDFTAAPQLRVLVASTSGTSGNKSSTLADTMTANDPTGLGTHPIRFISLSALSTPRGRRNSTPPISRTTHWTIRGAPTARRTYAIREYADTTFAFKPSLLERHVGSRRSFPAPVRSRRWRSTSKASG